jgi:hypothetical protein
MPGEGDVTALPLFRRELDSSLFSFWREDPFGFAIFSWTALRIRFS